MLVNNAGYGSYGALEDVPRRQFEVNLFGAARLIQLALPMMRAHPLRGGRRREVLPVLQPRSVGPHAGQADVALLGG